MRIAPPLRRLIEAVPATVPFVGPETLQRARGGRAFRARLGANENGFGPSPRALAAITAAAPSVWRYADPTSHDLIAAIAAHEKIRPDNIVVGEGIDGLLGLTVHLFADPGSAIVTSDGAYPTFNFHAACHGARLVKVPYRDDREDLDALVAAAKREAAVIVYLANPDNPMGTWWPKADVEALVRRLPPGVLLCLDEAYIDTLSAAERPDIEPGEPNVVRFRTFSKAYGLAGARIGYAIGAPSLIAAYDKVRNHYGINRLGQIAAHAAIADQDYLADVVGRIERAKARIASMATASGLRPIPSAAGFVAIDCGRDGPFARSILDGLLARDVFARKPAVAPLDRCIRISAGPDADLDVLAAALTEAVAAARAGVGG
ncbi:MAG: pyridoxal phosphate-dependent aminotransferase [Hyphomicrobiaceae bacterium]|nr:pyridoxal phosphate-dependent aminotransferase [Hyphomicrobiaceae bacterium]